MYWLQQIVETETITSVEGFLSYLQNSKNLIKTLDLSREWSVSYKKTFSELDIYAGAGLNLADLVSCPSYNCRIKQVDVLFRHAWHYFDRIFLPDAVTIHLLDFAYGDHKEQAADLLGTSFAIFLYLKQINATPLVEYTPAYTVDFENDTLVKNIVNSRSLNAAKHKLKKSLKENGKFTFHIEENKGMVVDFSHPDIPIHTSIGFSQELDRELAKDMMINDVYDDHFKYFKEDIAASQALNVPLGSTLWTHNMLLNRRGKSIAPLRLEMPSINNIPLKELLTLRRNEKAAFIRFRNSLLIAQKELVSNGHLNENKVSKQIENDLIIPELAKIDCLLKSAESSLKKKMAVAAGVCTITATCGLIAGLADNVIQLSSITALLTTAATSALQHVDKKKEIEMSDMFFLWKALGHA